MNTITTVKLSRTHKLLLRVTILLALMSLASAASAQEAWDHINAPRFQLLAPFANQAVLDIETGVVWERNPSGAAFTWSTAQDHCNALVVGKRMGWRLPTIQELTSILSIGSAPNNLDPGNPFIAPPTLGQAIWSSTTSASNPSNAWTMNLPGSVSKFSKGVLARCWCVRFRQGVDSQ